MAARVHVRIGNVCMVAGSQTGGGLAHCSRCMLSTAALTVPRAVHLRSSRGDDLRVKQCLSCTAGPDTAA